MASFYGPDATIHPRVGEDIPALLFLALGNVLEDAHILVNAHTGGRNSREVDLIIITPNSVYVVEVKDLRSPVTATANGPWFVTGSDGQPQRIANATRGLLESPVLQAQNSARAVEESLMALAPLGAWVKTLRIYAYVVIPFPSASNQIDYHGGPVRVVQGIDAFLKSVVDREYPRTVGPLGYGLTDAAAKAYIAGLGLVEYDLITLAHNGRPDPVVVSPVRPTRRHGCPSPRPHHPGARHDAEVRLMVERNTEQLRETVLAALPPESKQPPELILPTGTDQAPQADSSQSAPIAAPVATTAWRRFRGRLASALRSITQGRHN